MNTYTPRTSFCPECNGNRYITDQDNLGFVDRTCDLCDGFGKTDAACAWCEVVRPLDDEGYCEKCMTVVSAPVADLGSGWFRSAA